MNEIDRTAADAYVNSADTRDAREAVAATIAWVAGELRKTEGGERVYTLLDRARAAHLLADAVTMLEGYAIVHRVEDEE